MPAPAKKKRKSAVKKEYALYWCTTEDGSGDWFVVAASARQAARFHEDEEGFDRGDADAELVLVLPPPLTTKTGWRNGPEGMLLAQPYWPSDELLVAVGAEIAEERKGPRAARLGETAKFVHLGGRVFRAGSVIETVAGARRAPPTRLASFGGPKRVRLPAWWGWELELTPHLEKRMEDRDFTEVDLRLMLEYATSHRRSETDGRFVIVTRHRGKPWEVVVEPDEFEHLLVVVTAYGVDR